MTTVKRICVLLVALCLALLLLSSCGGSSSKSSSRNYNNSGYGSPRQGESLSDYIKREDPELYSYMEGRYDALTGK